MPDETPGAPQSPGGSGSDDPTTLNETRLVGTGGLPPIAASRWGEFKLIRELGRGAFGRVYLAFDEGLAKEVALKVVRLAHPSHAAAAMREGQMMARVRHPNVVTVHAVRHVGDEIGFVMELVSGESLADRVTRSGLLGADEAAAIGRTLCHAVASVHAAGLIHRDIKAKNVMRAAGGRIVLMDFGAGREIETDGAVNESAGTPLYFAPEIFENAPASRASDIYSLGVLLYYLVTGAYPVEGRSMFDLAAAHGAGRRWLLADRRPDLPRDFIRVIEQALAPAPAARFRSAGEMLAALETIASGRPLVDVGAPGTSAGLGAHAALRWAAIAVGGLTTLALLGFLSNVVYAAAFGLGRFADHSVAGSAEVGLRALVPTTVFAVMPLAAWLVLRTVWQLTRPAIPPLSRLTSRVHSSVSTVVARHGPRDLSTRAQALLVAQLSVTAWLFFTFDELWPALYTPFERADASVWQVLYFGADQLGSVNHYQMLAATMAVVMALAWRELMRRPGAGSVIDRPLVVAGVGIACLLAGSIIVQYRLFNLSQLLPRYEVDGDRCYEVGRRDDAVKLFCPDVTPTTDRARSLILHASDARLLKPLPSLSPFLPAAVAAGRDSDEPR